jgi:hypothetical protein
MEAIEVAFFPPDGEERCSHASAAYERIRQLWLWAYLDRIGSTSQALRAG